MCLYWHLLPYRKAKHLPLIDLETAVTATTTDHFHYNLTF